MAELLLKVGPGSGYQDGDVLCAFNRRMIRCVHAQHLCHVRDAGKTGEGLRPLNSLSKKFYDLIHQYRFERVSQRSVRRVEISTGIEKIFSDKPDENGEYIDVAEYVKRRLSAGEHHDVFGARGKEIWYGGRVDLSDGKMDSAWLAISSVTDRTEDEPEFQLWPMGRLDIRNHLAVRVTDFDDDQQLGLVAPHLEVDGDGKPTGKELGRRNIKVDWKADLLDDLKVTEQQVSNKEFPIGRDVVISADKIRYESKDQPIQDDRSKLQSRVLGGRLSREG